MDGCYTRSVELKHERSVELKHERRVDQGIMKFSSIAKNAGQGRAENKEPLS